MADAKIIIPEVVEPDEKLPADLRALRRFARLMDEEFSLAGTRFRFGVDALVGLIPGVGDLVGSLLSTWIIVGALRHRVPLRVVFRMIANVVADLLFGSIPVAGDVFDFLFEENIMNMRLLEAHRDRRRPPRSVASITLAAIAIVSFVLFVALALVAVLAYFVFRLIGHRTWF